MTEENGKIGDSEIRQDSCDPSQTAEREKWEQACTQENESNTTDPATDSKRGSKDPEKSWFMCETDTDMAELHRNLSSSGITKKKITSVVLLFCLFQFLQMYRLPLKTVVFLLSSQENR